MEPPLMKTIDDTVPENGEDAEPLSVWQLVKSALAAGFGVQSSRNRNRDFSRGKPGQFIAVGIVLTATFVIAIIALVKLVLSSVGTQP